MPKTSPHWLSGELLFTPMANGGFSMYRNIYGLDVDWVIRGGSTAVKGIKYIKWPDWFNRERSSCFFENNRLNNGQSINARRFFRYGKQPYQV